MSTPRVCANAGPAMNATIRTTVAALLPRIIALLLYRYRSIGASFPIVVILGVIVQLKVTTVTL
jgi:hypothetical protein